jgi:hypothetical protein
VGLGGEGGVDAESLHGCESSEFPILPFQGKGGIMFIDSKKLDLFVALEGASARA